MCLEAWSSSVHIFPLLQYGPYTPKTDTATQVFLKFGTLTQTLEQHKLQDNRSESIVTTNIDIS